MVVDYVVRRVRLLHDLDDCGTYEWIRCPGNTRLTEFSSFRRSEGVTAPVDPKADQPSDVAARILDDFAQGRAASDPGRVRALQSSSKPVKRASAIPPDRNR